MATRVNKFFHGGATLFHGNHPILNVTASIYLPDKLQPVDLIFRVRIMARNMKDVSNPQVKGRMARRSSSKSSSKAKDEKETIAVLSQASWWWMKDPNHLVRDASKRSKRMRPGV